MIADLDSQPQDFSRLPSLLRLSEIGTLQLRTRASV